MKDLLQGKWVEEKIMINDKNGRMKWKEIWFLLRRNLIGFRDGRIRVESFEVHTNSSSASIP